MKVQKNAILGVAIQRIRQLLSRYEESKVLTHSPTIGSLREAYLKHFLADFVPPPFRLTSGFVTDCRGKTISPQIDLLVFDGSTLPPLFLNENIAIAPIEIAALIFEAKSQLTTAALEQISTRQAEIRKFRYAFTPSNRSYLYTSECIGLTEIILAFDSAVSLLTLKEWLVIEPAIAGVCIIGKHFVLRDPLSEHVEVIEGNSDLFETLQMVSYVHSFFRRYREDAERELNNIEIEGQRSFWPDLGAYLTYDLPD